MQVILDSLKYVVTAPFFWQSMGMTTATAMFIGAFLYDGQLKAVGKAVVTVLSYGFFVLFTGAMRILPRIFVSAPHPDMYAATITIILTTFFYIIGLFLGVWILSWYNKDK